MLALKAVVRSAVPGPVDWRGRYRKFSIIIRSEAVWVRP